MQLTPIPRWRSELTRLWSIRVAYFWLAMGRWPPIR